MYTLSLPFQVIPELNITQFLTFFLLGLILEYTATCRDLLSVIHLIDKIWFSTFKFRISSNTHFIKNATSITSCYAKVSAVNVLLTTLLNFLDCQVSIIYFPFDPSIIILPCEPRHFKLPKDASLKQINAALSITSILGNDNTTSVDFNILKKLFAVIKFLTLASLINPLRMLAAEAMSGLVFETQFS